MNTLNEKDILKGQIDLLNEIIKNNGGTYIGYKLRVLEDEYENFDLQRKKSVLYHFQGTTDEYTSFIKKYPIRISIADPYLISKNIYVWCYYALEDFKIEKQ